MTTYQALSSAIGKGPKFVCCLPALFWIVGLDTYRHGVFTREQSSLASIPNNARICKGKLEKCDSHPVRAQGAVLESIGVPDLGVLCFIEWDSSPYLAIGGHENRIRGFRETNIFKMV
jgi:hypothetical protein